MFIVALAKALPLAILALTKKTLSKLWQTEHQVPIAAKIVKDTQGYFLKEDFVCCLLAPLAQNLIIFFFGTNILPYKKCLE